jgi:nucleoside-diphosphate-sugar epimerase
MQARRKIAVAGATGTVGRHVVDVLEAEGHDVVGMSRSLGVNVVTGEALAEALEELYESGPLLPGPEATLAGLTFEE